MLKIIIFICSISLACIGFAQEKSLLGRVLSAEEGAPLPKATISIKELSEYAVSDTSGNFILSIPGKQVTLHITHVGFEAQTVLLPKEQNTIVIYLKRDETILKDVTVSTGYQNISKERATGSFTTINNALLNRRVGADILSRLENVSSGLLFDRRFNG